MDETAIPKPIPSCCTMLSTVEPVPAYSVERSPTVNVFTAVKIIDIQAPYHIKLNNIQAVAVDRSRNARQTIDPVIKNDAAINVFL